MGDYERSQQLLLQLWNECESDEDEVVGGSESESDNLDHVSPQISDPEEDIDFANIMEEDDEEHFTHKNYYIGRDKVTKWFKHCSTSRVRTRAENIITKLPGPKQYARNALKPLECWQLFFDENMLIDISRCTNLMIQQKSVNYKSKQNCSETNPTEIKALFGILYLAGVFRSSHRHLRDLWRSNGTGMDIIRIVMSYNRFSFLLLCLRFDNFENRPLRLQIDKLAPIRSVFEKFVSNCKEAYSPGQYVTLDEKLESFRGRCSFRQYIPNKPAKYGIKIQALVDSRSFYTINMEIYPGAQPDGPYKYSNSAYDVVDRMVEPISKTNRNVTFDNWYTSLEAVNNLRDKHNLTAVGTVRKGKTGKRMIPLEFENIKIRKINSSMFGFQKNNTLVSYVPTKNKYVILLSSLHHDDNLDKSTGEKKLPEIISFYNMTKGGVDTVDEMAGTYTVARNCRRWPLRIFYTLLDTGGINSQIVYKFNTNNYTLQRRLFLEELGRALIKPTIEVRKNNPHLPKLLRMKILDILGEPAEPTPQRPIGGKGRCQMCPRSKDRKTKYSCERCGLFICLDHVRSFCQNCGDLNVE